MTLPERREDILVQAQPTVADEAVYVSEWVSSAGVSQVRIRIGYTTNQSAQFRFEESLDASTICTSKAIAEVAVEEPGCAYFRVVIDRTGSVQPTDDTYQLSVRVGQRL